MLRKIAFGAAQSHESENLIRFPCLPNTILHAASQANHWALLITHFMEKFLGPWAVASFQKEGIGNVHKKQPRPWGPSLVGCMAENKTSSIFEYFTLYFTHSCALFHLRSWKSLWGKTKRRSSNTHFLVFQNCVHTDSYSSNPMQLLTRLRFKVGFCDSKPCVVCISLHDAHTNYLHQRQKLRLSEILSQVLFANCSYTIIIDTLWDGYPLVSVEHSEA